MKKKKEGRDGRKEERSDFPEKKKKKAFSILRDHVTILSLGTNKVYKISGITRR